MLPQVRGCRLHSHAAHDGPASSVPCLTLPCLPSLSAVTNTGTVGTVVDQIAAENDVGPSPPEAWQALQKVRTHPAASPACSPSSPCR
jgi:hypothetical protein